LTSPTSDGAAAPAEGEGKTDNEGRTASPNITRPAGRMGMRRMSSTRDACGHRTPGAQRRGSVDGRNPCLQRRGSEAGHRNPCARRGSVDIGSGEIKSAFAACAMETAKKCTSAIETANKCTRRISRDLQSGARRISNSGLTRSSPPSSRRNNSSGLAPDPVDEPDAPISTAEKPNPTCDDATALVPEWSRARSCVDSASRATGNSCSSNADVVQSLHQGNCAHHHDDASPIANLLLKEADAWHAVLAQHSLAMSTAQQLSRLPPDNDSKDRPFNDEQTTTSDLSEAAYCSALTNLASQCDSLIVEVMRLRGLRKARRGVEVPHAKEKVRQHSNDVLTTGQELAATASLSVSSVTSDLREVIETQQSQVSRLQALVQASEGAANPPLPKNAELMIGVRTEDGEIDSRPLDELFKIIHATSGELNETTLSRALTSLFHGSGAPSAEEQ